MITKVLILSFVLLNFAVAQDTSELLARLVDVRGAAENPCGGIIDPYFVRSYRGCAWYTVCFNNAVVREDRCPEGLRFNYAEQLCDFTDNVECDLDDRWRSLTCPTGATGIAVIPHPYVCSKYTGTTSSYLNLRKSQLEGRILSYREALENCFFRSV